MAKRIRRKLSDATKFKMRLAKLGTKNPMNGKHHTEDAKRKISKKLKDYWRLIPIE
ncbi:NUMOD3 domain-containing DNA-binding protein [uncultured Bacteroides sp.]|uniref:NUMOD3 domain-containing DNA-binding protein n=1 Tax=uncultured Bacteroides sp. TaxID=162156 RepID=UPI00280A9D24|nr:NUMOD3 domain-containing DNA-binding protein [uncultured Bacteroides sp.]